MVVAGETVVSVLGVKGWILTFHERVGVRRGIEVAEVET